MERARDGRLDRAASPAIEADTARREMQHRAATIARVGRARKQAARNQSIKDAGKGARMDVQYRRKLTRRQTGPQPNDPQRQPLRSRDAELACHSFGGRSESVNDGPDEPHELQRIGKGSRPGPPLRAFGCHRDGRTIAVNISRTFFA